VRAYLITTATVFALITVAHIARIVAESTTVIRDPLFAGSTVLSIGLFTWSIKLLRRKSEQ
jgi:hypothetical protein